MKILLATAFIVASLVSARGAVQNSQQSQSTDFVKSTELNLAAVKLFNDSRYDEALPLETQALELRENAVGPTGAELIPILTNLGETYRALKKLDDSVAFFTRAMKLAETAYGANDIRLTPILDPLAFLEYTLRHASSAESLFVKSLKIKEAALSANDPKIAETAFNLGQVYAARKNNKGAAPLLSRAIAIWEEGGDKQRQMLLKALEAQVLVLTALEKNDEVARLQRRIAELSTHDAIVNGGVMNGKALVLSTPEYPSVSGPHPSGTVQVQVLIDENGHVLTATAARSRLPMEFERVAERAARQSRFTPTFVGGKPVKVYGMIVYNFVAR